MNWQLAYPFRQLRVHHEVVNMFFRASELQFARNDSDNKGRASCSLHHSIRFIAQGIMHKDVTLP